MTGAFHRIERGRKATVGYILIVMMSGRWVVDISMAAKYNMVLIDMRCQNLGFDILHPISSLPCPTNKGVYKGSVVCRLPLCKRRCQC
jgi:hypothetical protein